MHHKQTEEREKTPTTNLPAAIIVCALFFLAVIVCCWIRTKNIRRGSKSRHFPALGHVALQAFPCPRLSRVIRLQSRASELLGYRVTWPIICSLCFPLLTWLCTPTGWTSVPEVYQLPAASQLQLPPSSSCLSFPFSCSPPVVYNGGHQPFSQ